MNQLKVFQFGLVALCCIFGLANGKPQENLRFPLGSVLYEPSHPESPVDCSKQGYYFDYSDRSHFYQCHDRVLYYFKCQDDLLFDTVNERCEPPKNLECNSVEGPCPNGSLTIISAQPSECSKSDRGYYNHPSDRSRFYKCWNGIRYDYACDIGLYFNRLTERCE